MSKPARWLHGEIERWIADGIISPDQAAREARLRIADENSWESRFEKILEYVPELGV